MAAPSDGRSAGYAIDGAIDGQTLVYSRDARGAASASG
jgi:hypothetical protein